MPDARNVSPLQANGWLLIGTIMIAVSIKFSYVCSFHISILISGILVSKAIRDC